MQSKKKKVWPYLFCVQVTFSLCKLNRYCQLRKQWSLTLLEIQLNGNNKLTVAVYLSVYCDKSGPQCRWIGSLRSISSCCGPCLYVCENMWTYLFFFWLFSTILQVCCPSKLAGPLINYWLSWNLMTFVNIQEYKCFKEIHQFAFILLFLLLTKFPWTSNELVWICSRASLSHGYFSSLWVNHTCSILER